MERKKKRGTTTFGEVKSLAEDPPIDPVTGALLLAALIPILTAVGTIVANELVAWERRGFKIW